MAFSFTVNQTPTTGSDVFFQWKTLLKAQGWTIRGNSDGTTFQNNPTDQITSGGSGANGMANNKAYWILRDPGGTREISCQRSTASNAQWRIKISPSAHFAAAASATQVPAATDEVVIAGGGTDAAPTFSTLLAADGTYRCQLAADGASPYGNYWCTYPTGGGNPNGGWLMDPLSPVDGSDPDAYIYYVSFNSASAWKGAASANDLSSEAATSAMKGYLGAVATSTNFVTIPGMPSWNPTGAATVWPNNIPTSPFSSKDIERFVEYGRRSGLAAPNGWKGVSTLMKWHTPSRSTGDTVNSKARIIIGEISLPWDGATTPLL